MFINKLSCPSEMITPLQGIALISSKSLQQRAEVICNIKSADLQSCSLYRFLLDLTILIFTLGH